MIHDTRYLTKDGVIRVLLLFSYSILLDHIIE